MSSDKLKCIIILSAKSSGSSALHNLLSRSPQPVRPVRKTRHFENETLYWTKAASVLGLPQVKMLDSEVPIDREQARRDLITLLSDNLDGYTPPQDDRELVFEGWRLLCYQFAPIFLEKSPHHLHQWSALELIAQATDHLEEIDFLIIGLVRNPMDTLYSAWTRWRSTPEQNQYQWLMAYENLLKFQERMGDQLVIVRYEDIVRNAASMKKVFQFIGAAETEIDDNYLHAKSVGKWRRQKSYGFRLADPVIQLATEFGYQKQELVNEASNLYWPVYRQVSRTLYQSSKWVLPMLRTAKRKLLGTSRRALADGS